MDNKQAWFWTRRWQDGEKEAEADIRAGRVHEFACAREAIAFLRERARTRQPATSDTEAKC